MPRKFLTVSLDSGSLVSLTALILWIGFQSIFSELVSKELDLTYSKQALVAESDSRI